MMGWMNYLSPASDSTGTKAGSRIGVLCVDDSPDMTRTMSMLLNANTATRCVGCVASADALLDAVRTLKPSVILLDATMPGKPPIEAVSELAASMPEVKTIVYSGHDAPEFIADVIRAGAWGFVSKLADPDAIIETIVHAASGGVWPAPRS